MSLRMFQTFLRGTSGRYRHSRNSDYRFPALARLPWWTSPDGKGLHHSTWPRNSTWTSQSMGVFVRVCVRVNGSMLWWWFSQLFVKTVRSSVQAVDSQCAGARPIIRSEQKRIRSVDVIYPIGIINAVSVKFPKSVGNLSFSGSRISRRAP
jgi:hypothetical protein